MSRATVIITASITALILSAMAAASASADWYINGVKLPAGSKTALSTKVVVDEPIVLNSPTLSLKVTCSGLGTVGPELVGKDVGKVMHLDFEGCSEIEPKTCEIKPATIETEPVTALAMLGTTPDNKVLFKPTAGAGHIFTALVLVGSCGIAGEKTISGSFVLDAPDGQAEQVTHLLDGIGPAGGNNSLELLTNKLYFEQGKALLKLASSSKWSFH
jgi:hypothetical protein